MESEEIIEYSGGRAGLHEYGWLKAGYELKKVELLRQELLSQNDVDFIDLIQHLTGNDVSSRAIALEDVWRHPSGDKRVLPYIEELLYDTTPCLLGIPFIFGEVRWLAAKALAAEREVLGLRKPVRLRNVVRPIDMKEYTMARKAAQVELKPGMEGVLENIAILRDMGYLPLVDLNLHPKVNEEPQDVTSLAPIPVLMPALPA